ncbi:hypothetical protein [Pseudophaeobacter sp. TrK17]|uniref:hypothetical protein n=1 Tax=Pseudophaeobacter sp. TrK17 TaxID=2815167 RepID=UPI0035D00228
MRVFTILGPSQSGKTTLTRARLGKLGEGLADVVAVGCMADQGKHLDKAVLLRALGGGLGDGNPVGGHSGRVGRAGHWRR